MSGGPRGPVAHVRRIESNSHDHPKTMQAVHITRHGGPEVLDVVDVPVPEPGPGEVRVRVLGVSVNHLDLWVRRGMPGFPVPFPRVPGCDGTGAVDRVLEHNRLDVLSLAALLGVLAGAGGPSGPNCDD